MHATYASIILAKAVIGSEDLRHPEMSAFIEGFTLRCHGGFTLQKVCFFSSYFRTTPNLLYL